MIDYSEVAEQMKEEIVQDFLKKHPGTKREEVVTKLVNGRVVVETIHTVFNKVSEKQKRDKILSKEDKLALKQLKKGADERFSNTILSIKTTREYGEWLFHCTLIVFTQEEYDENNLFLDDKTKLLKRRSIDLMYVRKKFADCMKGSAKPSPSLVQTMTVEYVNALMEQLRVQGALFGQEIAIGGKFSNGVRCFITDNIDNFKDVDDKILEYIGQAFKFLKNNNINPIHVTGKEEHKLLAASLDTLDGKLQQRRKQFKQIMSLVDLLNTLVDHLKEVSLNEPKAPRQDGPVQKSGHRMAFTSRKGTSGRR